MYAARIAERRSVSRNAVDTEIVVRRRSLEKRRRQEEKKKIYDGLRDTGDKINSSRPKYLKAAKAEEDILSVMLNWPDKLSRLCEFVSEEDFVTDFNRRVFLAVRDMSEQNPCADFRQNLIQLFSTEEVAHINAHTVGTEAMSVDTDDALREIAENLKREKRRITGMAFGSDDAVAARIESLRGGNKNGNS